MKHLQEKIFERKDLSFDESAFIFEKLLKGEQDQVTMASLLVGLKTKGESPAEVAGAAFALRGNASPFLRPEYATADSCGTGGSGKQTLNISTLVALIAAVKGLKMVKHGNRSVSSQCGSADVLQRLGVKIDMSPEIARRCLDLVGVTFLFAPLYHPGVKHVMPVRNQLATRTIFNLLGPLINPAAPDYQLMGVYAPDYCYAAAESLRLSGCKSAMVVHSNGCDEITLSGPTHVAELKNGKITEYDLFPSDFGLNETPLSTIVGGTAEKNTEIFVDLLQGKASSAVIDTVAANTGALFYITRQSTSIQQGVNDAKAIIQSGQGFDKLLALAEVSQSECAA